VHTHSRVILLALTAAVACGTAEAARVSTTAPAKYMRLSGDLGVCVTAQGIYNANIVTTVLVDRVDVTGLVRIEEVVTTSTDEDQDGELEIFLARYDIDFAAVQLDGARLIRVITEVHGPAGSATSHNTVSIWEPATLVSGFEEYDPQLNGNTFSCSLIVRQVGRLSLTFQVLVNGVDRTAASGLSDQVIRIEHGLGDPSFTVFRWSTVSFDMAAIGATCGDEGVLRAFVSNGDGDSFEPDPVRFQVTD